MKYYLDTEFLNYKKKPLFGKPIDTVELISIGIVSDNMEYYAISKDFNLKEAWNKWQWKYHDLPMAPIKEYWLRDNVLKSIFKELVDKAVKDIEENGVNCNACSLLESDLDFTYSNLKHLIKRYGKTNKQIAGEIREFVYKGSECSGNIEMWGKDILLEFYAYFGAFDYVVFSQLFGDFSQYPDGFPMYFIDLKQILDEKIKDKVSISSRFFGVKISDNVNPIEIVEALPGYPKKTNEHSAKEDAKWNNKLHEFLNEF